MGGRERESKRGREGGRERVREGGKEGEGEGGREGEIEKRFTLWHQILKGIHNIHII